MFEEEKMNSKKVFTILGAFVLVAAVIGVTVAAYTWQFTGTKTSTISTGNISMSLLESTDVINVANALPIDDASAKALTGTNEKFDFAVTTSATGAPGTISYDIKITKVAVDSGATALSDNQVKVYLTSLSGTSTITETQVVAPTKVSSIITSGTTGTLKGNIQKNHSTANKTYTDRYRLRMWIDQDVDASSWTSSTKYQYKLKVSANGTLS